MQDPTEQVLQRLQSDQEYATKFVKAMPEVAKRRTMLKALGGAGALAAMSGGATASLSSSDADPDIGAPSDRPDGFFDGADANDLEVKNAELQAAIDGYVVPVASGLGVEDAIDPSSTSTPIQDAIDAINSAGAYGQVLLPNSVDTPGNITNFKNISITSATGGSGVIGTVVSDTDSSTPTFDVAGTDDAVGAFIDGVQFNGGNSRTAPFIQFGAEVNDFNIGHIKLNNYSGDNIITCNTGGPYQSTWHHVQTTGGYNKFLEHSGATAIWKFGHVSLNSDDASTPEIDVPSASGKFVRFDSINKGGTECVLYNNTPKTTTDMWSFGIVNYEPITTNTGTEHVFYERGNGLFRLECLRVQTGLNDGLVVLDDAERNFVGQILNNLSDNVKIETDLREPSVYCGPSSLVTNGPGSGNLTGQLSCLGDLTAVS